MSKDHVLYTFIGWLKSAIFLNSVLIARQIVLASHPVQTYSSRTVFSVRRNPFNNCAFRHNHQPRRLRVVDIQGRSNLIK